MDGSPPSTPSRTRRPNTMHWLSRNSQSSAPAKPTRISEPKLIRSNELLTQPRSGTLGSGATVVRTPDEALRETRVRLTYDGKPDTGPPNSEEQRTRNSITSHKILTSASLLPSPATSASELSLASPPLPKLDVEELEALKPPRPTRVPPSVPSASLRSSLKPRPVQQVDDVTTVPSLPAHLPTAAAPPPFQPILVSEVPTDTVDHSKIIVTIETSTASHKTTLETLKSRPSHLSEYLRSLFPPDRTSVPSSVHSHASDDLLVYRRHLISQGLLSQASFSVHLFLDRPSTPYPHILNYLRSPLDSQDAPETLPTSIQMISSHQRLESLLELRDEAAYLGLESLCKLCVDEIRLRHGPRLHTRGPSTSTAVQSMHGSVSSLHALLESVESDIQSNPRNSRSSASTSANDSVDMLTSRLLPTPQSSNGSPSRRSKERLNPPTGWI
ncbi:hypothetical protein C0989_000679 [Termitomyces sp. Mn162]|nr:hypothetical protein C0989_000679 [Termitomyces sp. Mn162]